MAAHPTLLPARIPDDQCIVWHIPCNHTTSPNKSIPANRNTAYNRCIRSNSRSPKKQSLSIQAGTINLCPWLGDIGQYTVRAKEHVICQTATRLDRNTDRDLNATPDHYSPTN